MTEAVSPNVVARDWRRVQIHAIVASVLCLVDSLVTMLGMTLMFTIVAIVIGLPLMAFNALRQQWLQVKMRGIVVLVYAVATTVCVIMTGVQNQIARSRAETIVEAGKRYHAQFGQYPKELDDLVPEFLPEVPRAKAVLVGNHFNYAAVPEGKHLLSWTEVGYLRTVYEFESDSWTRID